MHSKTWAVYSFLRKMRSTALQRILVGALLFLEFHFIVCQSSLAASNSALTLAAFVPARYSVTLEKSAAIETKSVLAKATQDSELAQIVEYNNVSGVFTVQISSENHGRLNSDQENGPSYTLTYNSAPVNLGSEQTVASSYRQAGTKTVHVLRARFDADSKFSPSKVTSGMYSDTLTFSVAVN